LRPFFRAAANRIFDINVPLDRDPLPRILDVGCGFGDLLLYWKSRGADTLGVDFDPRAVNQAARLGLRVLLGNLADLNLPAASFDIVVFNHSLEHIASPSAMLELASRLLRPGGEIHITVPNGASAGLEIEKAAWAALCFPVHFWFFDVTTITRAIKSTGFHKVIYKTANMWRHRIVKFRFAASAEKIKIWQVCKKNLLEDNRGDLIGIVAVKR
jgi:2-polyprenyl-3-methyl-5-hydroxy-6-metoxy-1,4-benzoquinol methylase